MAAEKAKRREVKDDSRISSLPENAESSGFLNNVRCVIEKSEVCFYDYAGKVDESGDPIEVPAIHWELSSEGWDENRHQYWAAGSKLRLVPSDDGEYFERAPDSTAKGLKKGSNAHMLVESLKVAGFNVSKLDSKGYSCLEGLHFQAITVPGAKIGERQFDVVVVDEIFRMPGDKKDAKYEGSGKASGKKKKDEDEDEADPDDEDEDKGEEDADEDKDTIEVTLGQECVLQLLEKNDDKLSLSKLVNLASMALKNNKKRKTIIDEIQDDDFIEVGEKAGLWESNGKVLTKTLAE